MDSAKDEIIKKIRLASENRRTVENKDPDNSDSFLYKTSTSITNQFIDEFKSVSGEIFLCKSEDEILTSLKTIVSKKKIKSLFCIDSFVQKFSIDAKIPYLSESDDFNNMDAGFTGCEFLVAQTGSVIISSAQNSGRRLNVFPPIHIIYADQSQIVGNLEDGIKNVITKYKNNLPSMMSTITGASRTADIEKTLVMGAHGPKEVVVLLKI